jgi:hypothetical protein
VELYKYLTGEVKRLAKHLPKREVASFQKGASHEVCARLKELGEARRKQFQATSSGKGLVLHKAGLIAEAYGKFSYGTSKSNVTDYAAYAKGQAAGRGINLSEQITGDKREAIE